MLLLSKEIELPPAEELDVFLGICLPFIIRNEISKIAQSSKVIESDVYTFILGYASREPGLTN